MNGPSRHLWRRAATAALLSAAVASGAFLLADAWVGRRGRDHLAEDADAVPDREWAVVPGARVMPDGRPSPALEDRLACALGLWRAGKVRRVLVSGNPLAADGDEVAAMAAWLRDRGLPEDALARDPRGFRTLDTMQRASDVFGVRDAALCTQRFHLPRSLLLARASGIDAVGVPADRQAYRRARLDRARESLARTRAVLDLYVLKTRYSQ